MKESDVVKLYRRHKLAVQMSSYSFELLLTFLHDQNAMTLLSIINRYISINVLTGQPQRSSEIRAMPNTQMEEMATANRVQISWGMLDDTKKLLDRVDESPEQREAREKEEKEAAAAAATEDEEDAMEVDDEGDGKSKPKRTKKDSKAAGAKKKRKRGDEEETVKAVLPLPKMSDEQESNILNDLRSRASLSPEALPSICFYTFFNTYANMNCSAVSTDSSLVAAGFSDSTVKMWDMYRESPTTKAYNNWVQADGRSQKYTPAHGARDPNGPQVQGSSPSQNEFSELVGHSQPVYSLSFSPDNRYLLSSSADGTARLWSTETRTNLVAYRGHSYPIWSAQFSPAGFYFATASHDRTARLWRTDQIFPIRVFAGHLSDVNTVQFHPNCNYIMTGSSDKCLRFWEVHTGNCVRIFTGHVAGIHAISISPNGRVAASAGEDKDIILWDLASSKRIATCKGHTAPVWSIDMSGDGNVLASGSADCTVRLWDMKMLRSPDAGNETQAKRPLLGVYPTKHTPVFSVSFTRRNLLLASGPYRPPPAVELNPAQLVQQPVQSVLQAHT
jgi:transcription initiation factor TFIID subunit 5